MAQPNETPIGIMDERSPAAMEKGEDVLCMAIAPFQYNFMLMYFT